MHALAAYLHSDIRLLYIEPSNDPKMAQVEKDAP